MSKKKFQTAAVLDPDNPAIAEEIAQKIENGSYYTDARLWYFDKYVNPVTERSFFVVVTTLALLTSVVAFAILYNFLPLVRKVPVVVSLESMTNLYARIVPIGLKSEEPNQSLVKYLAVRYVKSRESYNFEKLESRLTFIKEFSDPDIFEQYKSYVSIRNPQSPVLRYRDHTKRIIKPYLYKHITHREDPSLDPNTHKAFVKFRAVEINVLGEKETNWQAEIAFEASGIVFDREKKDFLPLDYEVLYYNVTQLDE